MCVLLALSCHTTEEVHKHTIVRTTNDKHFCGKSKF